MLEFIKWTVTILLSGGFFTFLQFMITRKDNKDDRYEELNKKVEDGLAEVENKGKERYDEYKETIEELRKVVVKLAENNEEQNKFLTANAQLLVGLTQDRLIHLTDKYCERGCITLDELAVLEEIYGPYHSEPLKGNGRGKAGIEMCRKLPKVSEEVAIAKDNELKHKQYVCST